MASSISAEDLSQRLKSNALQTRDMFLGNYGLKPAVDTKSYSIRLAAKINDEYSSVKDMAPTKPVARTATSKSGTKAGGAASAVAGLKKTNASGVRVEDVESEHEDKTELKQAGSTFDEIISSLPEVKQDGAGSSHVVTEYKVNNALVEKYGPTTQLILQKRQRSNVKPEWHAPWVLKNVISGHLGWVRCVAVDPANEWFCTGSADRTIKIFDLASGILKLTLTGHISTVRGLAVSPRHPYLFSVSEDKTVKCWDLEQNKVIRHYHGHLSGVYTCKVHPTLDLLVTGGRDSVARVWDMRTKAEVRVLGGHTDTVATLDCQDADPQIITGSHDSTIKLWDLTTGKTMSTLTHHKKSVRAVKIHPTEFTFASASTDNIKMWKFPKGEFMRNAIDHNVLTNSLALNRNNVLVGGGDNGSLHLYDWKTGHCFQQIQTQVQPGSLDSEAGIFALDFDVTGSRLISCEADKTIKIYKEDENATPETHPVMYKPAKKTRF